MTKDAIRAPVLDRAVLDENTMGQLLLQRELFDIFFAQAPNLYDRMVAAVRGGDRAEWRAVAHAFKGSSQALGLSRVVAVAARAEAGTISQADLRALAEALDEAQAAAASFMKTAA